MNPIYHELTVGMMIGGPPKSRAEMGLDAKAGTVWEQVNVIFWPLKNLMVEEIHPNGPSRRPK